MYKKASSILILILSGLMLFGCQPKAISELSPDDGMQRIRENSKDEHWDLVINDINEYRVRYPYSLFSNEALLLQADAYFQSSRYPEAITIYEEFIQKSPNHPQKVFAIYQIAHMYDLQSSETPEREQDYTYKALGKYANYVETFPNGENITEVKKRVTTLQRRIADHDLFIARFYFRKSQYESAVGRYEEMIKKYPQYEDIKTEAKKNIRISYNKLADILQKNPQSDQVVYFKNATPESLRAKANEGNLK